ncbi:helical backbone metal receptor [Alteromonas sp. H39]|uniref:helical backbone metal receptor n=1 Tax=Alteromonas sp. H39 TaxID=3389876 RepID=UPI0039E10D70
MRLLSAVLFAVWLLAVSHAVAAQRIVTLAPHLTEWAYSLDMGDTLVGVSAYSDYPEAAKALPQVADYNGVNFRALMALSPDLVLAWEGGNKPQDISRLKQLGFSVFLSSVRTPDDIADELEALGQLVNKERRAALLASEFREQLADLREKYHRATTTPVFYYSWTSPLMTVGKDAWANQLLAVCGARTIFTDAPNDYPQVSIQEVLRRQPALLIAATRSSAQQASVFWEPHRNILDAPLITVDPDVTSRFTLRLLPALSRLCGSVSSIRQSQTASGKH